MSSKMKCRSLLGSVSMGENIAGCDVEWKTCRSVSARGLSRGMFSLTMLVEPGSDRYCILEDLRKGCGVLPKTSCWSFVSGKRPKHFFSKNIFSICKIHCHVL